jgi:hypothetical protein
MCDMASFLSNKEHWRELFHHYVTNPNFQQLVNSESDSQFRDGIANAFP